MNLYPLCFANSVDSLIPELWAQESLAILEENMVMARLVHRDFSPLVAAYGDVVNTRRAGEFTTKRKTAADSVVSQDATATNVAVPLDQHVYVTFTIKDSESSLSFKDLVEMFMQPAAMQMARGVDRALVGQAHAFFANKVGRLAEMTSSNAKDFVLDAREKMNVNKAYAAGRNLVLCPSAETSMLKTELFVAADKRGDMGSALEEARLGRILGFDCFLDQNVPNRTRTLADTVTCNHTAGAAPGDTGNKACTATGNGGDATGFVGCFVWLTGEGQPHWITAMTESTNLTGITLNSAYVNTVAANAVGYIYDKALVTGAYAAGYAKGITVNSIATSKLPVVGQMIAFGTTNSTRHTYTIIEVDAVSTTSVTVWLDRPLVYALTDADGAFPGPHGGFNLAFHRDAIAMVSRPLALPSSALGVRAAIGSYNDLSMRVAMQYDISSQGTIVTLDTLFGVKVLDDDLGCVVLS
jgi:hypothetical protein